MADIWMCSGRGCVDRESCHRFTAPVNKHWQSYFMRVPGWDKTCEYYWDNKDYKNEKTKKQID